MHEQTQQKVCKEIPEKKYLVGTHTHGCGYA